MKWMKVKKILSIVMALLLVLGLVPEANYARAAEVFEVWSSDDLENALSSFTSGDTIRLNAPIYYFEPITIDGKDVIFDLNGNTLCVSSVTGSAITVANNANMSLTGLGEFNVDQGCDGVVGVTVQNGGKATISNIASYSFAGTNTGVVASGTGCEVTILNSLKSDGKYIVINSNEYLPGNSTQGTGIDEGFQLYSVSSNTVRVSSYGFDSTSGTITAYNGSGGNIVIPSSIHGVAVTNIGAYAFDEADITGLTIPEGVITIGDYAFSSCKSLTNVVMPNTVTSMGIYAFAYDEVLESITLSENIGGISQGALACCEDLLSIKIPSEATIIDQDAFYNCYSLEDVEWALVNKVTKIGANAFLYCVELESLIIPEGVEEIGAEAFNSCLALRNIVIPASIQSLGYNALNTTSSGLQSCLILRTDMAPTTGTRLFYNYVPNLKIYVPASASGYDSAPWSNFSVVPYTKSSTNLTYEGNTAESGSVTGVNSAALGTILTVEGQGNLVKTGYRFMGWNTAADGSGTNFKEGASIVANGTDITLYAQWSLMYNISVEPLEHGKIVLEKETATEGEWVILDIIPDTGYHLEPGSLGYTMENGTEEFMNPSSDTWQEMYMPASNIVLTATFVPGEYDFDATTGTIVKYMGNDTNVVIPSTIDGVEVVKIDDEAFYYKNHLSSVTIPEGITSIGADAFSECSVLSEVNLPNSLITIGREAFEYCKELQTIVIPGSVNEIDDYAFNECSKLKEAYFRGNAPAIFGSDVFDNTSSEFTIIYNPTNTGFTTPTWNSYKTSPKIPVTLQSAVADGTANSVTSTKIDLTFNADISGLTADNITITDGTGVVVKGTVTGLGTSWSIALSSVTTQGDVSVTITAPTGYEISNSTMTVAVFKNNATNNSGGTGSGDNTSGGNTSGDNTSGGNTSGGNTSGDNTSGGNTSGGNTSGGNTSGGNTSGGSTSGDNTSSGSTGGNSTGVGSDTNETEDKNQPSIQGGTASGWNEIADVLKEMLADGNPDSLTIILNENANVPNQIFECIKGKNITINLKVADGIEWIINGSNIPKNFSSNGIDLRVSFNSGDIPTELLQDLSVKNATNTPLSLSYDGVFGFTATLRVKLNQAVQGQLANLFYYNPKTKALELQYIGTVDVDGNTLIEFTHASDYVVVADNGDTLKAEMEKITVTPAKKTLYVGGTKGKSIVLTPKLPDTLKGLTEDASKQKVITYKSSNAKVASVSKDGKVTALKSGKTTITTEITINGITKGIKTAIVVKKAYIKLEKSTDTMKKGKTYTFQVVGYGVETSKINWETTNSSILAINKSTGKATAKAAGTVYVVAKAGDVSVKIKVVVGK